MDQDLFQHICGYEHPQIETHLLWVFPSFFPWLSRCLTRKNRGCPSEKFSPPVDRPRSDVQGLKGIVPEVAVASDDVRMTQLFHDLRGGEAAGRCSEV